MPDSEIIPEPFTAEDLVDPEFIRLMADRIQRQYPDAEVWLFGSYAYGRPNRNSDVDFGIVMNFSGYEERRSIELGARLASGHGRVPIDIVLVQKDTFEERSKQPGWFEECIGKGKRL